MVASVGDDGVSTGAWSALANTVRLAVSVAVENAVVVPLVLVLVLVPAVPVVWSQAR